MKYWHVIRVVIALAFTFVVTVGLLLCSPWVVRAEATADLLTPSERQWLYHHQDDLWFAPDPLYAPFEFFNEETRRTEGLAHDYLDLIQKKIGFNFKIIRVASFAQIIDLAKEKKVAVVNAATKTPERSQYLLFTEPFVKIKNVILVRNSETRRISLEGLSGKKVAVVQGYAVTEFLSKSHPNIRLNIVPTDLNAIFNVAFGVSDAAIVDLATASYFTEKEGVSNLRIAAEVGYPIQLAIGSRKDWPELNVILEKGLAAISPAEREAIQRKWVHVNNEGVLHSKTFQVVIVSLITVSVLVIGAAVFWGNRQRKKINIKRHQAERALQKSEDLYRTIVETAQEGICLVDEHFYVSFVNQTMATILDYSIGDMEGRLISNFLFDDDFSDVVANTVNSPQKLDFGKHELRLRRKDGSGVWTLISVSNFPTGQNEPFKGALVMVTNISKLKDTENILVKARAAAEAANQAKSEFLANMSHEIRTPLTSIIGFANLLNEDFEFLKSPERRREELATIQRGSEHLLTIVNDILDLSKIEAAQLVIELVQVNVLQLIQNIISLLEPLARSKGIALVVVFDSPILVDVMTDPTRLRQVLLNLLGNSIKFTETGGVTLRLNSKERGNKNFLHLSVVDTGPGMTAEQQECIFKPFSQGDSSVTRRHGGTGLGLVICQRLVNLMGGEIAFTSEWGKGSEFTISVPVGLTSNRTVAQQFSAPMAPQAADIDVPLRGRILLVEDGIDIQMLIARVLRKYGADVDIADHGGIALTLLDRAAAENRPYDLLITDIQMPEIDGYTLIREVRRKHGNAVPILVMTAHAMGEDRIRCLDAGANGFLSKPVDMQNLKSSCKKFLR